MVGYNNITKCVHISINLTIYKSFHRIIKIPQKSFQQDIQESLQGILKFRLKFLQGWYLFQLHQQETLPTFKIISRQNFTFVIIKPLNPIANGGWLMYNDY
jgi:hypothetical protein